MSGVLIDIVAEVPCRGTMFR